MSQVVRRIELGSPAALVTRTGLRLADGIRFNEWAEIGRHLWELSDQFAWAAGDWLAYGAKRYERGQYDVAVQVLERSYNTVRGYKRVSESFESARRRALSDLSQTHLRWSHFEALAHLAEDIQDAMLDEAERQTWTVRELREEVAKIQGRVAAAPVFTIRLLDHIVRNGEIRAAALGVPVRDLTLTVLDLAYQLDDPVATLEAAGARRAITDGVEA
jgi:hypothetical protein